MELSKAIQGRRSIRKFDPSVPVSRDEVNKLLQAAVRSPSAGNAQPWHFVVVLNSSLRQGLAAAAMGQAFVAQAPVVIVVCADLARARKSYGQRGEELYCLQETAAAVQNLLLSAHAEGWGACWVGAFDEHRVTELLKLPPKLRPVALVPLGYPAEAPAARPRRSVDEVVSVRD